MQQKKYLVTGGAGFIGSAIVKKLLSDGYAVKVFDNQQRGSLKKLSNVTSKFEFISGDIRDETLLCKVSAGCDGIIHLAYVNGTKYFYSDPDLVLDIGVRGILSVINAGKKNKISELYLASSSEVYATPSIIPTPEDTPLVIPDPYNPRYSYGGGKIISELITIHMGQKYFKKVVIFRPHNIYGPDMGEEHVIPEFIRKMEKLNINGKTMNFKIQGTGKETRSYMYIDDFVDAFMLLLKKSKNLQTYNIGTSDEINSEKLAELISQSFNLNINVIPGKLALGGTPRRCPDTAKIHKLGFIPKISLKAGLAKTISWYTSHPKKP
jgi:nucleoside-diphosphate-sugar epimerase